MCQWYCIVVLGYCIVLYCIVLVYCIVILGYCIEVLYCIVLGLYCIGAVLYCGLYCTGALYWGAVLVYWCAGVLTYCIVGTMGIVGTRERCHVGITRRRVVQTHLASRQMHRTSRYERAPCARFRVRVRQASLGPPLRPPPQRLINH